jgi:hypothetical protein
VPTLTTPLDGVTATAATTVDAKSETEPSVLKSCDDSSAEQQGDQETKETAKETVNATSDTPVTPLETSTFNSRSFLCFT